MWKGELLKLWSCFRLSFSLKPSSAPKEGHQDGVETVMGPKGKGEEVDPARAPSALCSPEVLLGRDGALTLGRAYW